MVNHQRRSEAFGDLESPIADAASMAAIACMLIEDFLSQERATLDMDVPAKLRFERLEHWREALTFAVYQTDVLARAVRKKYYAEQEGCR